MPFSCIHSMYVSFPDMMQGDNGNIKVKGKFSDRISLAIIFYHCISLLYQHSIITFIVTLHYTTFLLVLNIYTIVLHQQNVSYFLIITISNSNYHSAKNKTIVLLTSRCCVYNTYRLVISVNFTCHSQMIMCILSLVYLVLGINGG